MEEEESGAKSTGFVSDPQQSWGGWEERDVGLTSTSKVETGKKTSALLTFVLAGPPTSDEDFTSDRPR